MPQEIIKSIAIVKKACAIANLHFKKIDSQIANSIVGVANQIIDNKLNDHFPLIV
jgi:fumarate hydratase class II